MYIVSITTRVSSVSIVNTIANLNVSTSPNTKIEKSKINDAVTYVYNTNNADMSLYTLTHLSV